MRAGPRPGEALNLLFITADQWRGDALSALGHPVVTTPNLDALAREGVLFAAHYANTSPCSPSRASLYTGLYQHNHRVVSNGTPLADRHTNWAREIAKAGREPWLIGYTDQTPDPAGLSPDDAHLTIRRERRYKFVHFAGLPPLLFDLQNDPHELANLAEKQNAASLRLAIGEALLAWRSRTSERAYSHLKATPSGLIQK